MYRVNFYFFLSCFFSGFSLVAQVPHDSLKLQTDTGVTVKMVQAPIGFNPSNAVTTNGWTIGYAMDVSRKLSSGQRINGLYTGMQPAHLLPTFLSLPYILMAPVDIFKDPTISMLTDSAFNYVHYTANCSINGVSVFPFGWGTSDYYALNGIMISTGFANFPKLKGVALNAVGSEFFFLEGISISGIYSFCVKGSGIQISLINYAHEFNGVQIGLLNRIGNRIIPFINLGFDK